MNKFNLYKLISTFLILAPSYVLAGSYNIGSGGDQSTFGSIVTFLQSGMDFLTGPWVKFTIAGSAILALMLWAAAPKEGAMGWIVRVIIAGLVALNIASWMALMGG